MTGIALFAEDTAHELFVSALIRRVAAEEGTTVDLAVRNATGGHGLALSALRRYTSDLAAGRDRFAEILVAAIDGNCNGHLQRRRHIEQAVGDRYAGHLVTAVPDPHVERWFLCDPAAVSRALGGTVIVEAPRYKCERGRYKTALRQAVAANGVTGPPLGGVEYAEDIAALLDLGRACAVSESFNRFIDDIRAARVAGSLT